MKRRTAFTLVEILVVISIIALLLSILLPVFVQVKVVANRTKCMANLKQVTTAITTYVSDQGQLPCNYYDDTPFSSDDADTLDPRGNYRHVLNPFLKSRNYEVLQCPVDRVDGTSKFKEVGSSYYYVGGRVHDPANITEEEQADLELLHEQGIVEVTSAYMPYFSINQGESPGPTGKDVQTALAGLGMTSDQIRDAWADARTTAHDLAANRADFYIPNLYEAFEYSGHKGIWPRSIRTADYWVMSKKVAVIDRDAMLPGEDCGSWHAYPQRDNPNDASTKLIPVHAGFLDGHVSTIEWNKYNYLYEPYVDAPADRNLESPVSREHDFY